MDLTQRLAGKVAVLDDFRTLEITAKGKTKTTRTLRADKGHEAELRALRAQLR